jgi:hypothetical protein
VGDSLRSQNGPGGVHEYALRATRPYINADQHVHVATLRLAATPEWCLGQLALMGGVSLVSRLTAVGAGRIIGYW